MQHRNRHHQRIAPGQFGQQAITHFIRLRKPHVVPVVVQPLELLRQRHFDQLDIDFGVFLAALHQEGAQARRCDAIGQRHAQVGRRSRPQPA